MAEVAARLGRPLAPHQRYMADVALEIDPDTGTLAYNEVVLIGPRQVTGKTEWLLPLATHRCLGMPSLAGDAQRVVWTAQTAEEARKRWRDVHIPRLQGSRQIRGRIADIRLRLSAEAIFWRNGSVWSPGSTTGKTSGTGDTLDLGILDEAWAQTWRTELGMRPTMMTRGDWAQLVLASMIPGLERAQPGSWQYLKDKRQVGRARVAAGVRTGMAFFDFAAADGSDPGDPATWRTCMPMLGRTVSERTVAADFASLPLVDFCAEYLGWEPTVSVPQWTLLPRQAWTDRLDPASTIAGTAAAAIEVSKERDQGWICTAGRRSDGHWHVEVVEPGYQVPADVRGVEWVERRAAEMWAKGEICGFGIDPRRPANSLIVPLRNRGIEVLTPNQGEIAGACGRFYDAAGGVRTAEELQAMGEAAPSGDGLWVYHLGQEVLDRALGNARRLDFGNGAFVFVDKGSAAVLSPLYGATLAMHCHAVLAPVDYDLLESVDNSRPCLCGRMLWVDDDGVWYHTDDSPACEVSGA